MSKIRETSAVQVGFYRAAWVELPVSSVRLVGLYSETFLILLKTGIYPMETLKVSVV